MSNIKKFVYLDGDGIGDRLELLLMDGRISDAVAFSNLIHESIQKICRGIKSTEGAELVYAGGDDIVFSVTEENWNVEVIQAFLEDFRSVTGCSMSGGGGGNIQEALLNLRRAKLSGKGKLII